MTPDRKQLTDQLVVRVPKGLHEALRRDAEANGRTVAQSARFHLARAVEPQQTGKRRAVKS
jgi:predicted HicB family RNase H-like nuclease